MPVKLESKIIDLACTTLRKEKVFTIERLISLLGCSRRTAQTKLSRWKTYTSYNKNSKYYTFPEIPRFDIHGLWRYNEISFSRHGNLKKSIIHLVNSSTSGLTGKELGDLLGLPPQNFVHHFRNCPGICREKHCGVYIHFSGQIEKYRSQRQHRIAVLALVTKEIITDSDAIMILVGIIKYHGISVEEILALPEIKRSKITKPAIHSFLEYHGLEKKILASRL